MSIKNYGIYLAYPPSVDLRYEGLGRHLAAFLKGATEKKESHFTIVCPSWSKESIKMLCISEDIHEDCFDVVTPKRIPFLLSSYFMILKLYNYNIIAKTVHFIRKSISILSKNILFTVSKLRRSNSPQTLKMEFTSSLLERNWVFELFQKIHQKESNAMLSMINKMPCIKAWYCPTAFWPDFNKIKAPKLLCVPDVVLSEFPIAFSNLGGNRFLQTFKSVEKTILTGEHYVTYSDHIKQNTLVERYGVDAQKVTSIPHATNVLSDLIKIQDCDSDQGQRYYCQKLFWSALSKCSNTGYIQNYSRMQPEESSLKFFFYASQFRPSKNIITLLEAYKYLLREKFISHKLILTGRPTHSPAVDEYIIKHQLSKDVLLLTKVSSSELAACYHLADLVINPSLSEGACPFTFGEALSVNTPVIMSDIPVTKEVITDPTLQEMMLFDPYDWRDLANRTLWALDNRQQLLENQLVVYAELKKRTWTQVVDEYVSLLDKISYNDDQPTGSNSFKQYSLNVQKESAELVAID